MPGSTRQRLAQRGHRRFPGPGAPRIMAPMLLKFLIILMLLAILASLFSGLFFINRDRGQGPRTVKALTVRVALSLLVFAVIILAFHMGWLIPSGGAR